MNTIWHKMWRICLVILILDLLFLAGWNLKLINPPEIAIRAAGVLALADMFAMVIAMVRKLPYDQAGKEESGKNNE